MGAPVIHEDTTRRRPLIEKIVVSCYTVPTETPESDGTLSWTETTLVLVEAKAGGRNRHRLFLCGCGDREVGGIAAG